MNDVEIRLVIIEPLLEVVVLEVLAQAEISCASRHLDMSSIQRDLRKKTILITSPSSLKDYQGTRDHEQFLAIISIGERNYPKVISVPESEAFRIPEVICDLIAKNSNTLQHAKDSSSLVVGVIPRVGVSTLTEMLERNVGDFLLSARRFPGVQMREVLMAEIDDHSILRLCAALNERGSESRECGVVINKVPETSAARRRLQGLEGELQGAGVSFFHPIYFDPDLQVTGIASSKTIRAARPLFDWIAKAN